MTNIKKVLIVEDDQDWLNTLSAKLQSEFDIILATDGEEAIAKVLDHRPEVILLDLLLPKLDGFKVLERIRKYPDAQIAQTHVVVLSNLWSDKDILQAKALKIDDYFVKANTKIEDVMACLRAIKIKS